MKKFIREIMSFFEPGYKRQIESIKELFTTIGLKKDIQDVIDINYAEIHSGNIVDLLYRFTDALLITQYKNMLYIIYKYGTILFDISQMEIYSIKKNKLIVVNKEGWEYTIPIKDDFTINKIQSDNITVNGIQYYIVRIDDTIYFFTSLSTQIKSFKANKEIEFVKDVNLIESMGNVFIVVSGIRGNKHVKIYYTANIFNPVHYKITDCFGNVTFSGAYLPQK